MRITSLLAVRVAALSVAAVSTFTARAQLSDSGDWPGAHLIIGVRGQRLDDATRQMLAEVRPAGVILLKENIASLGQTRALVNEIKTAVGLGGGVADFPLVAVDQEGGPINRLRLDNAPGAREMADKGDAYAQAVGEWYGRECRERGIGIVFAPVLDVFVEGSNEFLRNRTFGTDPETVGVMALAFAAGLMRQGVVPVGKHFPGHGASVQDSHKALATLPLTGEALQQTLLPFKKAAAAQLPALMTGHIACAELDPSMQPATLSRPMIIDLLRGRLNFQGLVVTDDMNMGAIRNNVGLADAAVQALGAGNDMALVCENKPEALEGVARAVQDAQVRGTLPAEQLNASLARLYALQEWLRAWNPPAPVDPAPESPLQELEPLTAAPAADAAQREPEPKPAAKESKGLYTVKKGDTLSTIARKSNLTVKELCRINKISPKKPIKAGQKLRLSQPSGEREGRKQ